METIKAYTDLQQSKKLAEILPIADMFYSYGMNTDTKKWCHDETPTIIDKSNKIDVGDIPCWSLAALLSVLPKLPKVAYDLVINSDECYLAFDDCSEKNVHEDFDGATPVDAVFNAIIWLKENKYIDK